MYKRLRNWVVVGSLLILAAAYWRVQWNSGPAVADETEVQIEGVALVERGDIRVTVSATGSISPSQQLSMRFALPGTVDQVLVEEGQFVRAGQVLARLDTVDLEFALREAELALELQQVALDALTAPPREADLGVAEAAVYAASAQLVAARDSTDAVDARIAELQLEISKNQLWQSQLQRDQFREFGEQIDIPLLQGQIQQSEASVSNAEYDVAIAEQQVSQVQSAGPNVGSVASAQAALVNAQAQLDRLLEGPTELEAELADARLQTAYLAVELTRHQIEQATLTAPFAGKVVLVNLTEGEVPPAGAAAIEIIDSSSYFIELAVDEVDIASLAVGQAVDVLLDALPGQPLAGQVSRIDSLATNLGGIITYIVRVTLDPTDVPLRVGMSATATVVVDEAVDVLRVPNRFVRLDRRTQQGFVIVRRPGGELVEVEVSLGRRNETYSEIRAGLAEGDEVVLLPRSFFNAFGFGP